ncbi:hypothetical protein DENIS_0302 [Desulfonema ishimotonii]|uniref:Uncharacterized protein n=1 Tax=Desulfonema ishimotonii TaxID=45657 RepID=A0A401FQX8_9BACT|nr:leucine-rich repeat domain-containing protein [Desulfonema ishimotonii]GBC59363.1 hypothetical protein DENIS_0302 [Desulfonema ishimotonii]
MNFRTIRHFLISFFLAVLCLLTVCPAGFGADTLYFPHVACQDLWQTEVTLFNTHESDGLTGTLTAYDNSGEVVSENDLTLEPSERLQMNVADEFSNAPEIGYMKFEVTSGSAAGYLKFYTEGRYRVALPAVSEVSGGDIHVPHIASNDEWWTGFGLVNTTDSDKTLTMAFDDGTTREIFLEAGAHDSFTLSDLFDGAAQPDIASAVIENGAGVIGLELFGSSSGSGGNYLSGILLTHETSSRLCFSHVASNEKWWTGIVVYNTSDQTGQLDFVPYREDGTPLTAQSVSIDPRGKYMGTVKDLDFPAETAWFQVSASVPVTGFELFGTQDQNQMAGYTCVNISRSSGGFGKLETGGWTGIAFVNTAEESADITLSAYDDGGNLVTQETMTMAPHEKAVALAAAFFEEDISGATCIRYTADRQIVGFQLNGDDTDMLLDALPASTLVPMAVAVTGSCAYQVSADNTVFTASGGSGDIRMTASDYCDWTADSDADWIVFTSAVSGIGDGIISYDVAPNPNTSLRTAVIAIAGMTISVSQSGAAVPDDNDDEIPVEFSDSVLESAVREAIGKPQGTLLMSDLATLSRLEIKDRNLTDLDGIQYCTALTALNLGLNSISDLSPLAGLGGLEELDLQWNQVTDLSPLGGLSNLERLILDGNTLSDLSPLGGLGNLSLLSLNWTKITSLDAVSNLDDMTSLTAKINGISDMNALSSLTGLTELDLSWNDISDISGLADLSGLTRLILKGNEIEDISALAGLDQLQYLDLSYNKIIQIGPLVTNTGIDDGDEVHLEVNLLDETSCGADIPELESRGVTVVSSCAN